MATIAFPIIALSVASAQAAPVIYMEEFRVGHSVDLNQGWYVCNEAQASTVMEQLINIEDDNSRRSKAAQMGCPFSLADTDGPSYQIVGVLHDVCEDRHKGYQLTQNGREDTTICGREGHALAVEKDGKRLTVIQLSLDIIYD